MLDELACALSLDGVEVPVSSLRALRAGVRGPDTPEEALAAGALALFDGLDALSERPVTERLLMGMFDELERSARGLRYAPAWRRPTPIYSICDHFSVRFVADSISGASPVSCPQILFVLFCSDAMWKKPIFARWNNTMELMVRGLLFSVIGAPLLRYVPLALPYWRWQSGMTIPVNADVPFDKAMFSTPFGADMTALFTCMLGFLERGLDGLAEWVGEQRTVNEQCRDAVQASCALNHRQRELLLDCIENPAETIDAVRYERRFDVVPSTAYADLRKLVDLGYLVADSTGKARTYRPARDLAERLASPCPIRPAR